MRTLRAFLIPLAVILFALPGCREEDVIKKDEVTHEDREALRLRVAFLTRGQAMWFFRITGPADLVKQNESAFDDFVKSVDFDDKKGPTPQFTEPKGWKADPWQTNQMTGQNTAVRLKSKPKELEILVTELSAKGFDLVANVHRWQKKINVPLAESFQEAEAMLKRTEVNSMEVSWIDMTGLGIHSVSKPAAPQVQIPKIAMPGMGPRRKPRGLPFTYSAPEKWVQKPPRQFVLDAYEISDAKEFGELTVTEAMGTVGANISRWRDQVKLPTIDDDKLEQAAQKRKIAGFDAYYVDLDSPNGPAGRNRILGVVIPTGAKTFFVKFTGPRDLLGQQKNAFETFLDSFQREGK